MSMTPHAYRLLEQAYWFFERFQFQLLFKTLEKNDFFYKLCSFYLTMEHTNGTNFIFETTYDSPCIQLCRTKFWCQNNKFQKASVSFIIQNYRKKTNSFISRSVSISLCKVSNSISLIFETAYGSVFMQANWTNFWLPKISSFELFPFHI